MAENTTVWTAIGVAILGWLLRLERRISQTLTRREHEALCERQHQIVAGSLDEIKEVLHGQGERAEEFRDRTTVELGRIRTDIAVVQVRMIK